MATRRRGERSLDVSIYFQRWHAFIAHATFKQSMYSARTGRTVWAAALAIPWDEERNAAWNTEAKRARMRQRSESFVRRGQVLMETWNHNYIIISIYYIYIHIYIYVYISSYINIYIYIDTIVFDDPTDLPFIFDDPIQSVNPIQCRSCSTGLAHNAIARAPLSQRGWMRVGACHWIVELNWIDEFNWDVEPPNK